jgi:hypothetical protein
LAKGSQICQISTASTGLFTYRPSLAPAGFTEYIYIMSNGHQSLYGSFDLGGYPDPDELVSQGEGLEQDIGGLQGDVTAVKAVTDTLSWADIDILIDLVGGNRLIQNNQMIYLSADGQTEVARFNLFDENGSPSEANIYRRERVHEPHHRWPGKAGQGHCGGPGTLPDPSAA